MRLDNYHTKKKTTVKNEDGSITATHETEEIVEHDFKPEKKVKSNLWTTFVLLLVGLLVAASLFFRDQ